MEAKWQIIETAAFILAVESIGGHEFCDSATEQITYALSKNPEGFNPIPGIDPNIRIAKTKLRVKGNQVYPALRMWVRFDISKMEVYKLYIQHCPPESMPFDEEWLAEL